MTKQHAAIPQGSWRTLLTYGRFQQTHADWPYVLGMGFGLLVLALFLSSCAATGVKVTEDQLLTFRKGETSCVDIVAHLGKPTWSELTAEGTRTLTYTYTQTQLKPETFVPILSMLQRGQTAETTHVTLWCDHRNVLTGYAASQGQERSGTGVLSGSRQR